MHLSFHSFTEFPFLKSSHYHSSERLLLPKTIFCSFVGLFKHRPSADLNLNIIQEDHVAEFILIYVLER